MQRLLLKHLRRRVSHLTVRIMSTELRTLIQRLDDESRAAMERAAELCAQQTHFSVDPEHLLVEL